QHCFKVTVPKLEGVSEAEVRQYILDAIAGWSGGFPADHPQFRGYRGQVNCVRLQRSQRS
ncbi:hypothetical protein LDZ95_31265, partial [Pseudomonas aeruginosa]|nr:hypothetical protein [Pseudomonas aeruginosa]